jgi:hypothetical protein
MKTSEGRDTGSTPARLRRERRTIDAMIALYCRTHHRTGDRTGGDRTSGDCLCDECSELQDYARARLRRCPYQEAKPTCANCPIHCYRPEMRERVREVMRFAGPRMLLRRPILALLHLLDGLRKPPAV